MGSAKFEVLMPKNKEQLESLFANIFKRRSQHIILRILENYLSLEDLLSVLKKNKDQIGRFRRNKSIVLLSTDYNYEHLPEYIPVAPTQEEAIDIIDFEEIERELMFE